MYTAQLQARKIIFEDLYVMENLYKIAIAFSERLDKERLNLIASIHELDKELHAYNTRIEVTSWNTVCPDYTLGRKQDDYNKMIEASNIFVLIFWAELGKYSHEEFQLAKKCLANGTMKHIFIFEKKTAPNWTEKRLPQEQLYQEFKAYLNQENKEQWPIYFEGEKEPGLELLHWIRKFFGDSNNTDFIYGSPAKTISNGAVLEPTGFLGREEELKIMEERLKKHSDLILVNAEGGMGKTTLAAHYFHKKKYAYTYNAWLNCTLSIKQALIQLEPQGAPMEYNDCKTLDEQVAKMKRCLKADKHCAHFLLVLDNANNADDLNWFVNEFSDMPWHVLITSRCNGILHNKELAITHLPPDLALQLFKSSYNEKNNPDFDQQADNLMQAFGYVTLLIDVFAKHLAKATQLPKSQGIKALLQQFESKGLFIENNNFVIQSVYEKEGKPKEASSNDILHILYDLTALNETQIYLLSNFALLPIAAYKGSFLIALFGVEENQDLNTSLINELDRLKRLGWVSRDRDELYKMSPVVQEVVLEKNKALLGTLSEPLLLNLLNNLDNDGSVFTNRSLAEVEAYIQPLVFLSSCLEEHPSEEIRRLNFRLALYERMRGNSSGELNALETFGKINANLLHLNNNNLDLYREQALYAYLLADYYLRLGDAQTAEKYYLECLGINRTLSAKDKSNTQWQQDLAASLSKLGNYYLRSGDAQDAEKYYLEDLVICRNLCTKDESNTSWRQDLATSLCNLGDYYLRLGDAQAAETHYLECLAISRKLCDKDESNTRWQQDLATSLGKLGDYYLHLGDAQATEAHYLEGLLIRRNLIAKDESNTRWQQDLATSLGKLGDCYFETDRLKEAIEFYVESKNKILTLLEKQNNNVRWLFDYALSQMRIGRVFAHVKHENTLEVLNEAKQVLEHLRSLIPDDVNYKHHYNMVCAWMEEYEGGA